MTKKALINVTLDYLLEIVKTMPECFEILDKDVTPEIHISGPIIRWSYKLNLNGEIINDPNNIARTIVVQYNQLLNQLTCNIYSREVSAQSYATPDASMTMRFRAPKMLLFIYPELRKFFKLRKKLLKIARHRENDKFFKNLRSIFPDVFDNKLLD